MYKGMGATVTLFTKVRLRWLMTAGRIVLLLLLRLCAERIKGALNFEAPADPCRYREKRSAMGWNLNTSIMGGLEWCSPKARRRFRILANYYHGFNPYG